MNQKMQMLKNLKSSKTMHSVFNVFYSLMTYYFYRNLIDPYIILILNRLYH